MCEIVEPRCSSIFESGGGGSGADRHLESRSSETLRSLSLSLGDVIPSDRQAARLRAAMRVSSELGSRSGRGDLAYDRSEHAA